MIRTFKKHGGNGELTLLSFINKQQEVIGERKTWTPNSPWIFMEPNCKLRPPGSNSKGVQQSRSRDYFPHTMFVISSASGTQGWRYIVQHIPISNLHTKSTIYMLNHLQHPQGIHLGNWPNKITNCKLKDIPVSFLGALSCMAYGNVLQV